VSPNRLIIGNQYHRPVTSTCDGLLRLSHLLGRRWGIQDGQMNRRGRMGRHLPLPYVVQGTFRANNQYAAVASVDDNIDHYLRLSAAHIHEQPDGRKMVGEPETGLLVPPRLGSAGEGGEPYGVKLAHLVGRPVLLRQLPDLRLYICFGQAGGFNDFSRHGWADRVPPCPGLGVPPTARDVAGYMVALERAGPQQLIAPETQLRAGYDLQDLQDFHAPYDTTRNPDTI